MVRFDISFVFALTNEKDTSRQDPHFIEYLFYHMSAVDETQGDGVLAQYELEGCNINQAAFHGGYITFGHDALELALAMDEGSQTLINPLVVAYESLVSIKVPRMEYIKITISSDIVASWAEETGMEFDAAADSLSEIEMCLPKDCVREIYETIGPTISANRRARSSSRWSATELLPLKSYAVTLASQLSSTAGVVTIEAQSLPVSIAKPSQTVAVSADVHPDLTSLKAPCVTEVVPTSTVAVNPLFCTPDEDAPIRLQRRTTATILPETPKSRSLPSSILEQSPIATVTKKKRPTTREVVPVKQVQPTMEKSGTQKQEKVAQTGADCSDDEPDVPLGALMSTVAKVCDSAVSYNFFDVSTPHEAVTVQKKPEMSRQTRSKSVTDAPPKRKPRVTKAAPTPAVGPVRKPNAVVPNPTVVVAPPRALTPVPASCPPPAHQSRIRMPTPSIGRPSVARSIRQQSTAPVVGTSDHDAAALKALLEQGLGEDNLEEFLKSATKIGKRVREAKRQREESVLRVNSGDLVELARCATELIKNCATERDARRTKYFKFFGAHITSLLEQSNTLATSIASAVQQQATLQENLASIVETMERDHQRWDAVESADVDAAIASIREKLLGTTSA